MYDGKNAAGIVKNIISASLILLCCGSCRIRDFSAPKVPGIENEFFKKTPAASLAVFIDDCKTDSNSVSGIKAIREKNYKKAIGCLCEYRDINAAIAYLSLDYNASALKVLEGLPPSGKRDYLLAVAYSRTGNGQRALQYYISAGLQDVSFRFRAHSDPEISRLIKNTI